MGVRVRVFRSEHAHFEKCRPRNLMRVLRTENSYSDLKVPNERFTAAYSRCRQNLKYENFTSSRATLRQKIASKKRALSAARLFFLIQAIKSLI